MDGPEGTALALEGQVWVCAACGKRAKSRWGHDAAGNSTVIDDGYDSSCMSHAVLCFEEREPDGAWRAVGAMHYIFMKIDLDLSTEEPAAPAAET